MDSRGNFIRINPHFKKPANVYINPSFLRGSEVSTVGRGGFEKGGEFSGGLEGVQVEEKGCNSKFIWRRREEDGRGSKIRQNSSAEKIRNKPDDNLKRHTEPKCLPHAQKWKQHRKFSWTRKETSSSTNKNLSLMISPSGNKLIRKSLLKKYFPSKFSVDKRPLEARAKPKRCRNFKQNGEKNTAGGKLIRIGDFLYRVSSKKLRRAAKPTGMKTPIINIKGQKYLLKNDGKVLQRLPQSGEKSDHNLTVHFGGVQYRRTSSSDKQLVRTNFHLTKQILTTARHRSISFLNKRRKINTPCLIYRRLGKCHRHQTNTCPFDHDPKTIDICKRFLRGECDAPSCPLSHKIDHHKLPTCKYFLIGSCGRENCPYLHVKLNDKTEICREFQQGYCPRGQKCSLRHVGKECRKRRKKAKVRKEVKEVKVEDKPSRYYREEAAGGEIQVLPQKGKLDDLPAFIAL